MSVAHTSQEKLQVAGCSLKSQPDWLNFSYEVGGLSRFKLQKKSRRKNLQVQVKVVAFFYWKKIKKKEK